MHCDACEKNITRALQNVGITVDSVNRQTGKLVVRYDNEKHSFSSLKKVIGDLGYELLADTGAPHTADVNVGFSHRFRRVFSSFMSKNGEFAFEKSIIKSSIGTLAVVTALMYLVYAVLYWNIDNFWKDYGQYVAYLIVAVVSAGAAVRQQRAYRASVSCMSGMMIGMTIGMISSMLLGIVMGVTNGMFTGAIFSMAIGMGIGAWVGACCGIMGVMEGMMAGLMGGTMGPMISVMMISDRIDYFLPIFFLACLCILAGLVYLVHKEQMPKRPTITPYSFWPFTFLNFSVIFAGSLIMVWGPRAAFFMK